MRKAITALIISVIILTLFGLVAVYSASDAIKGGATSQFKSQAVMAIVGSFLLFFFAKMNYRIFNSRTSIIVITVACFIATSLALPFSPISSEINGASRWIDFSKMGLFKYTLQPSEFSRIGFAIVLAAWYDQIGFGVKRFKKGVLIPLGCFVIPFIGTIFLEPDLGATVVMAATCGVIALDAGIKFKYLGYGALLLSVILALYISTDGHRRSRLKTYWDNMRGVDSAEVTSYQTDQSIEAFANGGWRGVGIGESIQKHRYLPEANSDFIFAIIAEEFGIIATVGIVALFVIILMSGLYIAMHAPDRFGRLLVLGLSFMIVFQAAFNIGMVIGLLPTKGIALPFTSAGGTSLLASMIIVGIIISVGTRAMRNSNRNQFIDKFNA